MGSGKQGETGFSLQTAAGGKSVWAMRGTREGRDPGTQREDVGAHSVGPTRKLDGGHEGEAGPQVGGRGSGRSPERPAGSRPARPPPECGAGLSPRACAVLLRSKSALA